MSLRLGIGGVAIITEQVVAGKPAIGFQVTDGGVDIGSPLVLLADGGGEPAPLAGNDDAV
ncbi:hypothetical protein ACFP9U_04935 [Nitratireductor sp. GCM10026969]